MHIFLALESGRCNIEKKREKRKECESYISLLCKRFDASRSLQGRPPSSVPFIHSELQRFIILALPEQMNQVLGTAFYFIAPVLHRIVSFPTKSMQIGETAAATLRGDKCDRTWPSQVADIIRISKNINTVRIL
jgi:hypothetical protein